MPKSLPLFFSRLHSQQLVFSDPSSVVPRNPYVQLQRLLGELQKGAFANAQDTTKRSIGLQPREVLAMTRQIGVSPVHALMMSMDQPQNRLEEQRVFE